MLFSIVIPVYNVEKYLEECLESIVKQINTIEEKCEVLLIDDGSTDRSGKICDNYVSLYPDFVKVFHNQNQGLLMTRRFGYKKASGEYIINCDSDDTLEDNALKCITNVIRNYNSPDMIIFNHNQYDGKHKTPAFENVLSDKETSEVSKKAVINAFMQGYKIVSVWGAVCKHSCIDIDADYSKFARISNGEDSLQKLEQFDRANSFVYLNKCLYNYRTGSGMTCKFDSNFFNGFSFVFEEIEKRKISLDISDVNFAEKVLSTTGRSITQLRYGLLQSYSDWESYLKDIRNSRFFEDNIHELSDVKDLLQRDHVILLKLLKFKQYYIIYLLLSIKNMYEKLKLIARRS